MGRLVSRGRWQEMMESPGMLLGAGPERELAEVLAQEEDQVLTGEWARGEPKLPGSGQELEGQRQS